MTRDEQHKQKDAKKQAKIALRIERRDQEKDARNWQKFIIRMKMLGALIEQ